MDGMHDGIERNLGEQPIKKVMEDCRVAARDLVEASTEQITFKMVSRACKGRRVSPGVRLKILNALVNATGKRFAMEDLFDYS